MNGFVKKHIKRKHMQISSKMGRGQTDRQTKNYKRTVTYKV